MENLCESFSNLGVKKDHRKIKILWNGCNKCLCNTYFPLENRNRLPHVEQVYALIMALNIVLKGWGRGRGKGCGQSTHRNVVSINVVRALYLVNGRQLHSAVVNCRHKLHHHDIAIK